MEKLHQGEMCLDVHSRLDNNTSRKKIKSTNSSVVKFDVIKVGQLYNNCIINNISFNVNEPSNKDNFLDELRLGVIKIFIGVAILVISAIIINYFGIK